MVVRFSGRRARLPAVVAAFEQEARHRGRDRGEQADAEKHQRRGGEPPLGRHGHHVSIPDGGQRHDPPPQRVEWRLNGTVDAVARPPNVSSHATS